ncbi:winged helix-turn-helix transcriptional regulator [Methanorbis rubei]|uniref:Winged helix-turn-helix transcriptional regulator n=1 Tax=Methanorbis rubei TaxID=3028300 RepID=A0AAE4SB53_9EURY|nr:hypothetical protein [Methanocorpusculaceae archaeon Cs1]
MGTGGVKTDSKTRLRISLLLNLLLLAAICCLLLISITGENSGSYSDDEYRAYQNSVYYGLDATYPEYLAQKYPEKYTNTKLGIFYLADVRPITSDTLKISEMKTVIKITDEDFRSHPALGKIFIANAPFTTVQLSQEEYNNLAIYFQEGVIIEWNGTLYQSFVVSGIMLGAAAVLGTGLFLFACTRRKISDDPASRVMQIAEYIKTHPGCSMSDIITNTGFSRGSVSYNLHRLRAAGRIQKITRHGVVRYYSSHAETNTLDEYLSDILRKEKPSQIFEAVRNHPGITQKEIAKATKLSVSTVQWHLTRMVLDAVIEQTREKKMNHYMIRPEYLDVHKEMQNRTTKHK